MPSTHFIPPKITLDFLKKTEVTYKQRIFDITSQELTPLSYYFNPKRIFLHFNLEIESRYYDD